jgi:hypothetical protein
VSHHDASAESCAQSASRKGADEFADHAAPAHALRVPAGSAPVVVARLTRRASLSWVASSPPKRQALRGSIHRLLSWRPQSDRETGARSCGDIRILGSLNLFQLG